MRRILPPVVAAIGAAILIFTSGPAAAQPARIAPASASAVLDFHQAVHTARPVRRQTPPVGWYEVRQGDTLSLIARRELGSARAWPELWWANRHQIANPNEITQGQRLRIPASTPVPGWLARRAAKSAGAISVAPGVAAASIGSSHGGGLGPYGIPPASFTSCVIRIESGGYPHVINTSSGASGLFGIEPALWLDRNPPFGPETLYGLTSAYPGGAYTAPSSTQYRAFYIIYSYLGSSPWRPYDGC